MCVVYIISVLSSSHIVGHALCVLFILSVFWVVVILLAMLYVCCLYYQCLTSSGYIVGHALCVLFILSVFWVVVILLAMLYVCCLYYQCFELWSYCWPCFMCAVYIISVLMSSGHIVGHALCVLFILSVCWWVVVILLAMLYVCCLYYQCFELWSYRWPCFMCVVYIISVLMSSGHIVGHALCVLFILSVFLVVVILLACFMCAVYIHSKAHTAPPPCSWRKCWIVFVIYHTGD